MRRSDNDVFSDFCLTNVSKNNSVYHIEVNLMKFCENSSSGLRLNLKRAVYRHYRQAKRELTFRF